MIKGLNLVIGFCKLLKPVLLAPAHVLNGVPETGWNVCSVQKCGCCADVAAVL